MLRLVIDTEPQSDLRQRRRRVGSSLPTGPSPTCTARRSTRSIGQSEGTFSAASDEVARSISADAEVLRTGQPKFDEERADH